MHAGCAGHWGGKSSKTCTWVGLKTEGDAAPITHQSEHRESLQGSNWPLSNDTAD